VCANVGQLSRGQIGLEHLISGLSQIAALWADVNGR
jgi:hypothetical protein